MIQMLLFLIVTEQLPRHRALEQSYSFEDQQFQNLLDWSRMLTLNISIFYPKFIYIYHYFNFKYYKTIIIF